MAVDTTNEIQTEKFIPEQDPLVLRVFKKGATNQKT